MKQTSEAVSDFFYEKNKIFISFRSGKSYSYRGTAQEFAAMHAVKSLGTWVNEKLKKRKATLVTKARILELVKVRKAKLAA